MTQTSVDTQVETILFGSEFGDAPLREQMAHELRERLLESQATNSPLRVYAGYDPSRPDLHLGHSITLRKLRQFQDFGHEVTFLSEHSRLKLGIQATRQNSDPD